MPYPFAHPAAVLPLPWLLGRFAVPSALAIGSLVPDLWYLVPQASRDTSHGAEGLVLFCLPVGLTLYLLFHFVLKQPLIALLSARLGRFTTQGLPAVPWRAVIVSLLAGALTHVAWDGLTHLEEHRWVQHASTALGSAILALWSWRKLRSAPPAPQVLPAFLRAVVLASILLAGCACAWLAAGDLWMPEDIEALRRLLRGAAPAAFAGLACATLAYCLVWQAALPRRK